MNQNQIRRFLQNHESKRERTMVIVDFGNVDKWKHSLKWQIGIQELANLVKHFSRGRRYLRRFYYGSDYGKKESSQQLEPWSRGILTRAEMNGFEVVTKRVKYIPSPDNVYGYEKKCDLDIEMAIDMIREQENYDTLVLFSGDGDLACALSYIHQEFSKECIVFGARDHIGREMFDAKNDKIVSQLFFADDFEYRLDMYRGRR